MLNAPVVPHNQGIFGPTDPALETCVTHNELVEATQYHLAFPRRHAFYVRGKTSIDKQDGFTAFRVRSHDRVAGLRIGLTWLKTDPVISQVDHAIMQRLLAIEQYFQVLREFFPCETHVRKHRIATTIFRDLGHIKQ